MSQPKILVFDVETAPILAYIWQKGEQHVGLGQIKEDWYLLAWAAKWYGDPASKVMYADQRHASTIENDKPILAKLWKLLDEADIVITQNGKIFDSKKLNARFILNGMKPPSPYRHLDTLKMSARVATFTSHSLEYVSDKVCVKYKKLKHKKFPGLTLWKECLAKNPAAWAEMKRYNVHDVLATEEFYNKIQAWDSSIDFNVYTDDEYKKCNCGSMNFIQRGYSFTSNGKFKRFVCRECGKWMASRQNLISPDDRRYLWKSAGSH